MRNLAFVLFASVLGCAASPGIVQIGPDTYMISEQGWIATQSVGELKTTAYQKAGAHCTALGRQLMPVSTNQTPGVLGRSYPEMELQFMCLTPEDYELRRPKMAPAPSTVIHEQRGPSE